MNSRNNQNQAQRQAVVVSELQRARLPITAELAEQFGVTDSQWRVLIDQVFPAAKSIEAVSMALTYCRARNLDIFKKPVHIVPMWSSALNRLVETVWPGISEIRTTAARTGEYAGIDEAVYGPEVTFKITKDATNERGDSFKIEKEITYPAWCRVTVYRVVKGEPRAFHAKVFWREAYATEARGSDIPNEMWKKRPFGQIEKVAEAAALRKAFPEEVGNEYAAEEMAGRVIDHDAAEQPTTAAPRATTPHRPPAPPAPPKPSQELANQDDVVDAEVVEDLRNTGVNAEADLSDTEFFERLEEAMGSAPDEATLEELWTELDPLARFEGKPNGEVNQGIALAMKKRAAKRIGAGK